MQRRHRNVSWSKPLTTPKPKIIDKRISAAPYDSQHEEQFFSESQLEIVFESLPIILLDQHQKRQLLEDCLTKEVDTALGAVLMREPEVDTMGGVMDAEPDTVRGGYKRPKKGYGDREDSWMMEVENTRISKKPIAQNSNKTITTLKRNSRQPSLIPLPQPFYYQPPQILQLRLQKHSPQPRQSIPVVLPSTHRSVIYNYAFGYNGQKLPFTKHSRIFPKSLHMKFNVTQTKVNHTPTSRLELTRRKKSRVEAMVTEEGEDGLGGLKERWDGEVKGCANRMRTVA